MIFKNLIFANRKNIVIFKFDNDKSEIIYVLFFKLRLLEFFLLAIICALKINREIEIAHSWFLKLKFLHCDYYIFSCKSNLNHILLPCFSIN